MPLDFQAVFIQLQQLGVYDYVLPFLLVFTIVFAILEKTRIFGVEDGKPRKNINVVVALVIGLLLVAQQPVVQIINLFLPKISLFIVVILMFLVLTGIFGTDPEKGFTGLPLVIAVILSIIAVIWALSPSIGFEFPSWFIPSDQDIAVIVLIAGVIAIIYYIGREPKKDQDFVEKLVRGLKGK